MKKLFLLLAIISLLFAIPSIVQIGDQPLAEGGGCCMERDNLSEDNWYDNGLSRRKCLDLNRRKDGDNLYMKTGYIYWERNC
jgi:hypothetical protein